MPCPQCANFLRPGATECYECGWRAPALDPEPAAAPARVRYCAFHPDLGHDAVQLTEPLGWCEAGEGYPTHWTFPPKPRDPRIRVPLRCPFACPRCRHPLSWNGGCDACKGSSTPRDPHTWAFTGDYYDVDWSADAGRGYGHYRKIHGPVPFSTEPEVMGYVAALHAIVGRVAAKLSVSADEGPERPPTLPQDGP
jgi:hypothetical protein